MRWARYQKHPVANDNVLAHLNGSLALLDAPDDHKPDARTPAPCVSPRMVVKDTVIVTAHPKDHPKNQSGYRIVTVGQLLTAKEFALKQQQESKSDD